MGAHAEGRRPNSDLVGVVLGVLAAVALLAAVPSRGAAPASTRLLSVAFRGPGGYLDHLVASMPSWYGPRHDPPLPVIISPHSRGATALANARRWGGLPGRFRLIALSPSLHGRVIPRRSWAWPPDVAELARLPQIARRLIPYLRFDPSRIYALGHSMGAQEALMLLADRPRLLAGVVAADPVTNLARRWYELPASGESWHEQRAVTREVGATPRQAPWLYAQRSPSSFVARIAASGVPLELWWNPHDTVVIDQRSAQTGAFYRELRRLDPRAPVVARVHHFEHGWVFKYDHELPAMVRFLLVHRRHSSGAQLVPLRARHLRA
jgi:pimeloyl-ACP methyl ester carboxylesterase